MTPTLPERFAVTGTDTDVGKTVVSAVLAKGLSANYWKPVQAGLDGSTDLGDVQRWTGLPSDHFIPEVYRLNTPASPHLAAQIDGVQIDLKHFYLPRETGSRPIIVEGAGGVLVPLNGEFYMADLFKHLQLPVLVVARSGLGTINHTLMTLESLRHRGLEVLGVVLNGPKNQNNRLAVEKYGRVKVLAELEHLAALNPETLQDSYQNAFLGA